MRAIALLVALASCEPHDVLGTGWDLPALDNVYQCDVGADGEQLELCWDGDAKSLALSLAAHLGERASCVTTPRHLGPCIYGCEPHSGCNATSGCFCPVPDDEE